MLLGSLTIANSFIRPWQRGHVNTSTAKGVREQLGPGGAMRAIHPLAGASTPA
jgi:hypothetical protein